MSSFACTVLILVAVSHFKEIPASEIKDYPRFDNEHNVLKRLETTEYVQKQMQNTLLQLQKEVRNLKTRLEEKGIEIRKLLDSESKGIKSKVVGFSVSTTVGLYNFYPHKLLVFNDVIYDPYEAYDRNTGIYTVPVSGTYLISGSIFAQPGNRMQTEIIAGGRSVSRMYAYSRDTYDQGASSVVVDLKAGSNIFMRVDEWGSESLYGGRWTSMSAVYLKPDYSTS